MYPNLKLRLWTTGLRQNRLAKMLDMDETTLSKIVNGFRHPTPEVRSRIAAALASEEAWLFQVPTESATTAVSLNGMAPPAAPPRRPVRRNRVSAGI